MCCLFGMHHVRNRLLHAGGRWVNMLWLIRLIVQPDVDQSNLDCKWELFPIRKKAASFSSSRSISPASVIVFFKRRPIRHICLPPIIVQLCVPDSTSISLPHPHIQLAVSKRAPNASNDTSSQLTRKVLAAAVCVPVWSRSYFLLNRKHSLLTTAWGPAVHKMCLFQAAAS